MAHPHSTVINSPAIVPYERQNMATHQRAPQTIRSVDMVALDTRLVMGVKE